MSVRLSPCHPPSTLRRPIPSSPPPTSTLPLPPPHPAAVTAFHLGPVAGASAPVIESPERDPLHRLHHGRGRGQYRLRMVRRVVTVCLCDHLSLIYICVICSIADGFDVVFLLQSPFCFFGYFVLCVSAAISPSFCSLLCLSSIRFF